MISSDELMSHAARCTRLAEASKDDAVAAKFRQLARDYCELATSAPTYANVTDLLLTQENGKEGTLDGQRLTACHVRYR